MLMTWTTPGTFPCITVLSLRGSWWRTWCSSPRYLDVPCGVPGRGLWNLRSCGDIIRSLSLHSARLRTRAQSLRDWDCLGYLTYMLR